MARMRRQRVDRRAEESGDTSQGRRKYESLSLVDAWKWKHGVSAAFARTTKVVSYFRQLRSDPISPEPLDLPPFRAAGAIWLFPPKVVFYFPFPTEVVS